MVSARARVRMMLYWIITLLPAILYVIGRWGQDELLSSVGLYGIIGGETLIILLIVARGKRLAGKAGTEVETLQKFHTALTAGQYIFGHYNSREQLENARNDGKVFVFVAAGNVIAAGMVFLAIAGGIVVISNWEPIKNIISTSMGSQFSVLLPFLTIFLIYYGIACVLSWGSYLVVAPRGILHVYARVPTLIPWKSIKRIEIKGKLYSPKDKALGDDAARALQLAIEYGKEQVYRISPRFFAHPEFPKGREMSSFLTLVQTYWAPFRAELPKT